MDTRVHNEGYEILYCQNTATATIDIDHPDNERSTVEGLDSLIPLDDFGVAIACRFTNWDVTVKLNMNVSKGATGTIFDFVSDILRAIPNLNKLKVQLNLWDTEPRKFITYTTILSILMTLLSRSFVLSQSYGSSKLILLIKKDT